MHLYTYHISPYRQIFNKLPENHLTLFQYRVIYANELHKIGKTQAESLETFSRC